MTNPASAIVNSVGSTRQDFEAKQDTARLDLMIASVLPDKIGTSVQARMPLRITAPRRAPDPPGTAFTRWSHSSLTSIGKMETMSWIAETGTPRLSNITKRLTTDEWRDQMRRFLIVLAPLLTAACFF